VIAFCKHRIAERLDQTTPASPAATT